MEYRSLTNYVPPDARKVFANFKCNYGNAFKNYMVKHFLDQEYNYRLFTTAVCFPTEENWRRLDQTFRRFYIEIRFINYISKVIWRYAKDSHIKSQRNEGRYLLILDQPISKEESSTTTYKDQLADSSQNTISEGGSLLTQIKNIYLQEALKHLTDKQLRVLNRYYVCGDTQEEMAHQLGISQQSISKVLKTALDRLKDFYEREETNFS